MADVVGHGIAAAMLMAKLCRSTLLLGQPPPSAGLRRSINALPIYSWRDSSPSVPSFRSKSGNVTIVNAGHICDLKRQAMGSIEQPEMQRPAFHGILDDYD